MPRRIHLSMDVHESPVPALFMQEALRRDLTRFASEQWPTTAKLDYPDALWANSGAHGSEVALELDGGALALVSVGFGNAFAQVAAATDEAAKAGLEAIRSRLPRATRDREGRVPVRFWSYGPHGPMPMGRTLSVPSWEEIAGNYPAAARDGLARLMTGDLPWRGGQLILWHGETGTGKTTALRALAREWASWCEPHYITDPEKFFGDQSDYMLSVMLESEMYGEQDDETDFEVSGTFATVVSSVGHGMWAVPPFGARFGHGQSDGTSSPSWKLLILEDTGELLSADARIQAGQGLSRFLNVVDGLIGQGLRILVLVTTNEELGKLHPAISRPGRCASNVLFTRIPVDQANAWLAEHEHEGKVTEPTTLAGLYALVEGWDAVTQRQATGFGQD